MNFGGGMRLPNMNLGNGGINNRGFNNNNNNQGRFNTGFNNNSFNRVSKPEQTFKSLDGTIWASYDQAMAHNRKIYSGEVAYKSNNFK